MHNLTPGDKMCCRVDTVLGRQNVPCKSAYVVVPHRMNINIHSDIFLLNMKEAIYYILVYVHNYYIHYDIVSALAIIFVVLTML